MDEPSRTAKWLTVLVMAIVTSAAVWVSLTYGDTLYRLAATWGPAGQLPQIYLWGALIALCVAMWVGAYLISALVQRSFNVWGGFWILPLLLLAVGGVNFGPEYGPRAVDELKYVWFEKADQEAILAVKEDNAAQIIAINNICQTQLEKLAFPDFMEAPSLGAPHGLERALEKFKKARAIFDDCHRRDAAQRARYKKAIDALAVSEKAKREAFAAEFETGPDSAQAQRAALGKIENDLLAEIGRTLDDLYACKDLWFVSGNQILFARKRDLNVFNAHVGKVRKLLAEGDAFDRRLREKRDKTEYVVIWKNSGN